MKKIGICFIGCGNHANRFVYPALSGLPDAALLAVCSLDPEEAETNRRRHGAAHAYTDYREMIRRERPEAVIVVGPPQLHFEAGAFCIECGIPFYTEKPSGRRRPAGAGAGRTGGSGGSLRPGRLHDASQRGNPRSRAAHGGAPDRRAGVRHRALFHQRPLPLRRNLRNAGNGRLSFLRRYLADQAVHRSTSRRRSSGISRKSPPKSGFPAKTS